MRRFLFVSTLAALLVSCGGGGGPAPLEPIANPALASLQLTDNSLEQPFDSNQTEYTALVGFLVASIQIKASASDPAATLTVNSEPIGADGATIPLEEGDNVISVNVTAASGSGRTYTLTVTRQLAAAFAQDAYIKASNAGAGDHFGLKIALSGKTLAGGAHHEASAATGINGDQSDNSAPVSGAVYVFVKDASGAWSQQAYIKASNTDGHDWFGWTVALSGNTLAVGAIHESSAATGINGDQSNSDVPNRGAVYVYVRDEAGVWSQEAYIKASYAPLGRFGFSVALDSKGSTLAVGVGTGAVYVFVRDSLGAWSEEAYVKGSNTESGDRFGGGMDQAGGLAIDGDTLAVSAIAEDSGATGINGDQADNTQRGAGAVYVFVRDSVDTWSQQAYVKASNTDAGDGFGFSVALSNDTLVVGAPSEGSAAAGVNGDQSDNSAAAAGATYVFMRDTGGNWSQQAYLKASNAEAKDRFGHAAAISGDVLAVGAHRESSTATGVGGDQTDNRTFDAGAAYVFVRDTVGTWSQRAYIKASNSDIADQFGYSLALSGDQLAVGVWSEDSIATGIDGDQSDNSAPGASAVYVFGGRPNRNANLATLDLANTELDQIFQPNQPYYSADVGFLNASIHLSAAGENSQASVYVNGIRVGPEGIEISLEEGSNSIEIEVIASDGVTAMSYSLTVTRATSAQFAQRAYVKASNTGRGDHFGKSIAVSGDILVVGSPNEDGGSRVVNGDQDNNDSILSGAVYVFTRDASHVWSQEAYIKAPNADAEDRFGSRVALSGDTLAVGAPGEDSATHGINNQGVDNWAPNAGAVYIFARTSTGIWQHRAYIKASNTGTDDQFGSSVALSGDTLAVGAPKEDGAAIGVNPPLIDNSAAQAGAVYVFERDAVGAWFQKAYIKASNTYRYSYFGASVALSDDTLAVGAPYEDGATTGINGNQSDTSAPNAGAAYVFVRDRAGDWSQQAYVKASNTSTTDSFGLPVALSGDTLAVGATQEDSATTGINGDQSDDSATSAGAAYLYRRDEAGDWSQQAYVKASNTSAGDRFGDFIGLSGSTLVVGALEDSSATGIGGDQFDDSSDASGAVYVYHRNDTGTWVQAAFIKSSNSEALDYFGACFLAIDGDTLVVGANYEDSVSTGIEGDQADNSLEDSGAIYVFR